jgi:hypothetical protein
MKDKGQKNLKNDVDSNWNHLSPHRNLVSG